VRRAAIEILIDADRSGEFVDEVLSRRIREFDPRDRHLLQEIAYGAVRHRGTLDHLLNQHLKAPPSKQRPPLRWALRIAAYQLVYLGRIPPHAAVNQTLEGLKGIEGVTRKDVGFVNAVLHKLASDIRKKTAAPPLDRDDPTVLPIRKGFCHFSRPVLPLHRLDAVQHIALKYSYPPWLAARWIERFGEEEARLLCEAQNRTPPLTARVTAAAPSREAAIASLEAEGMAAVSGNLEGSVFIQKVSDLERSETFAKGWLQVEDETAIRIGAALSPPPGARALDLCAAPGGKALQLLEAVGPSGHVTAADRSEEKLALVRENLSRIGSNFTTVVLPPDPTAIDLGEKFSHILVDAPCSNTGVLARRPEARWRIRRDDLAALAKLQGELLEAALRHLAPGGRLVYATCSIEPEENEGLVASVFSRHGELVERETRLFLPHRNPGDGGFFSLLIRPPL
jgi:16S rRNA (cytosine967-C5)-methyltransferase